MRTLTMSLLLAVTATGTARAQEWLNGRSPPAARDGDPLSKQAARQGLPLRLQLLDPRELADIPSSFECVDGAERIRPSHTLIELQSAVLRLTPRFTLHAFSRWGCAPSVAVGGGFTYAVKLSPKLTAVLAGGLVGDPHSEYPPFGTGSVGNSWLVRPVLRADVQWRTKDGDLRSVGVDAWKVIRSAVKAGLKGKGGVSASVSGQF